VAKQADLLSVDIAQRRILDRFGPLQAEPVSLSEGLGRVLARDVTAALDIPPFANSSMDGFAVRSADTAGASPQNPLELQVVAHIPAGSGASTPVGAGQAARIMTGGPLPVGTDSVVPLEDVSEAPSCIRLTSPVAPRACVRDRAQDVRLGTRVLPTGTQLGYPQIGLLGALGCAEVSVTRRPVVAILSTGDELVPPGTPLRRGQIYNSNSPMLAAAVAEAGGLAAEIPSARDDPGAIAEALRSVPQADLILTSGGASVGDHDHIKDVLSSAGQVEFWRVRVRPGKPILFGRFEETPVVGLPGNPTSAAVTFELFVRPVIRTMLGTAPFRPRVTAIVDDRIRHQGGRTTYVRVRLTLQGGRFHAAPAGHQDSAMLVPLAHADGLLVADEDRTDIAPGEQAEVLVWRLPEPSHWDAGS
jgi:molybdopterin molybdotransferase